MRIVNLVWGGVLGLAFSVGALGQAIYSENFDVDPTGNWTFNYSNATGGAANFFFDYSTVGIPPAPGSGGTTRGLKLEANIPGTGVFSGGSASPTGLVLPTEYILRAYVWQNANGPFPGGGNGSTQVTNMTVGATGTSAEFPGTTMSGVQGGVTGEGGSGVDWRLYSAAMPDGAGSVILPQNHPGVYAAGNAATDTNNSDAYYTSAFQGQTPPAAQLALYPQQMGAVQNGAPAFAWRLWEIVKTVDQISWTVDGTLIGTVPASLFPTSMGNNFALGYMDINAASSNDANARNLLFGLVDNVTVSPVPEPGAFAILGVAGIALLRRRRSGQRIHGSARY